MVSLKDLLTESKVRSTQSVIKWQYLINIGYTIYKKTRLSFDFKDVYVCMLSSNAAYFFQKHCFEKYSYNFTCHRARVASFQSNSGTCRNLAFRA